MRGNFEPLPLEEQVAGAERGAPERAAAAGIVELAADLVEECVDLCRDAGAEAAGERGAGARVARLGFATAGPKTDDGRGIALWRRGPRNALLLDELLVALGERGLTPSEPPTRLVDDSLAAVVGERVAAGGALREVGSAIVLAPGTDLAEAYLLQGVVTGRPASLPAPWEVPDPAGSSRDGGSMASQPRPSAPTTPTFGETIRLGRDADLAASFAALGRLAVLRLRALETLGLPGPELLVVGARGGSLLAANADLRAALAAGLRGALPFTASSLREAAAIGSLS